MKLPVTVFKITNKGCKIKHTQWPLKRYKKCQNKYFYINKCNPPPHKVFSTRTNQVMLMAVTEKQGSSQL